jgi:hypothetical protein
MHTSPWSWTLTRRQQTSQPEHNTQQTTSQAGDQTIPMHHKPYLSLDLTGTPKCLITDCVFLPFTAAAVPEPFHSQMRDTAPPPWGTRRAGVHPPTHLHCCCALADHEEG